MAEVREDRAAVLVRISKRTLQAIDKSAKKNRRSRNSEIVVVLSEFIEQQKSSAPEREAMR